MLGKETHLLTCYYYLILQVSQTIARGGPRCQIAIPAQGMIEFRDALQELLEEFGTDDGGYKGELPEGRHMRVENKNFYFDIGQNNRGIYMRISEVSIQAFFLIILTILQDSLKKFPKINILNIKINPLIFVNKCLCSEI